MKIIVAGSQNVTEEQAVRCFAQSRLLDYADVILSAGIQGVDTWIQNWTNGAQVFVDKYAPVWKSYDANWSEKPLLGATMRNVAMAKDGDGLVLILSKRDSKLENLLHCAMFYGLRIEMFDSDKKHSAVHTFGPKGVCRKRWAMHALSLLNNDEELANCLDSAGGYNKKDFNRAVNLMNRESEDEK